MKLQVRAVASPPIAVGLRLAGLHVDEAEHDDTADNIGGCIARSALVAGTGVLLVEQQLLDAIPDAVRQTLELQALPMIVPIPAAEFTATARGAEAYILALLHRAIGYRVRLQ